jgi:dTDP-4-dehydrorhamnose 3,5-epimerase-like enzyme
MVGAGAVVTRSVPPHAVVTGNPARITGYAQTSTTEVPTIPPTTNQPGRTELGVGAVHVQRFAEFFDLRGRLTAGDFPAEAIPFTPQRWFLVYDVPSREIRGEHAHRVCHQFLLCVSGQVTVAVDDGQNRGEVLLDDPTLGIYIPPLVWGSQYRYDADAVLLVLASHPYNPDDYIREYDQFLLETGTNAPRT